ncbi:MAG: flagellar assembly protein FliH [Pseudomonadota bacterium]
MSTASAVRWRLPSLDNPDTPAPQREDAIADAAESRETRAPSVDTPLNVDVPTGEPDTMGAVCHDDASQTVGVESPDVLDDTEDTPAALSNEALVAVRDAAQAEGFEAGHTEGYATGLEAGRSDGLAELATRIEQLSSLLAYLAKPLDDHDDRLEDELVALSVAVARQLVRRELSTSPGEIVPVVREALAALPSTQRNVSVCLHPDDAALVRDVLAESAESAVWTIAEDPLLSRGGCRVEAGYSHVDATLETRLQNIASALAVRSREDD